MVVNANFLTFPLSLCYDDRQFIFNNKLARDGTGFLVREGRVVKLNLNLLHTLKVILEQRNLTRSAQELRLTQSAISRQLSQLRGYFDDPLLVREGNDYFLTALAQQLKPRVLEILESINDLRQKEQFDPQLCQRRFSFACTDYVANFIFPELLSVLEGYRAGIDLNYQIWQPEWLVNLGARPLDFAATMTNDVPANIYGVHLGNDIPVVLMNKEHPLINKALSIDSMLKHAFVRITAGGEKDGFFDIEMNRLHRKRRIAFEVPFFSAAFNVVSETSMLLIVPRHIARKASEIYPITWKSLPLSQVPEHDYYLIWHCIHHNDTAHRWMRTIIADHLQNSMFSLRHSTD